MRGSRRRECIRTERCAGVRAAAPHTQVGVYNRAPAPRVYLPAAPRWDVPGPPIGRLTCAEYIFASARAKYAADVVKMTPRRRCCTYARYILFIPRTRDVIYNAILYNT